MSLIVSISPFKDVLNTVGCALILIGLNVAAYAAITLGYKMLKGGDDATMGIVLLGAASGIVIFDIIIFGLTLGLVEVV